MTNDLIGQTFRVLDHGHVILLDYMGSDDAIAREARVSRGEATDRDTKNNRNLIRYLMRKRHTSPFEFGAMKFLVKLPIFVERQWVRHRTFSTNEVSARHSILPEETYFPPNDRVCLQSQTNKQGSGEGVSDVIAQCFNDSIEASYVESFEAYRWALGQNITRELSRITLPVATYTEKVWCGNLHNLLHFLELRLDEDAQWEIRQYAQVIADIVKQLFPVTWEAFEDYRLNVIAFSRQELRCLAHMIAEVGDPMGAIESLPKREQDEFLAKIRKIREMK